MFRKWIFFCVALLALTSCGRQELNDESPSTQVTMTEEASSKENASESKADEAQTSDVDIADEQDTIAEETVEMRKPIDSSGFLKTKGKNIYDESGQGQLVQLKGVNAGGYLFQEFWMTPTRPSETEGIHAEHDIYRYLTDQYGEERMRELINVYQDAYWTEEDFDNLAEHGANVIRLPFWYLNIVDFEGEFVEGWYERFDWFIEEAGKRGIYVILDFHGAPGSQNGSDHSGVDGGDEKEAASEFFYGDEQSVLDNQELFYKIWEVVAERYQGNPVVAGYDLLNEPYCTYRYDSSVAVDDMHKTLWGIYDEAYKRIREIDDDHMIFMEATWDPVDLPDPKDYSWENVVYEYHNYYYGDYDNANGGQIANMAKKLNLIRKADYDLPSYMGEFSYFNSYEAWDEGLKLLSDAGLHWTMWTYRVTSNYGNWGLYHHNSSDISISAIDDEKLEIIWAKAGQSRPNSRLIEVVTRYFRQEPVAEE